MAAGSCFGTTSQARRFIQTHGLGDPDDPNNIVVARERIAEERERVGLPANSPLAPSRIPASALLVCGDQEVVPLAFAQFSDWAMVR
jgi:hypothetical protein